LHYTSRRVVWKRDGWNCLRRYVGVVDAKMLLSPAIIHPLRPRCCDINLYSFQPRANPYESFETLSVLLGQFCAPPKRPAMEAASARMAARDRYGGWGEAPTSQLQRFICRHFVWPLKMAC
jgi:hypothetical protein